MAARDSIKNRPNFHVQIDVQTQMFSAAMTFSATQWLIGE